MNKEQTKTLIDYCNLTFGHTNLSVSEALDCLDGDAYEAGLTRLQYLDYIAANGKLPEK